MFDQPIIERKSSSPLATSLLVLSAVCLLTAIVLVGAKIKDQTVVGAEKPTDRPDLVQQGAEEGDQKPGGDRRGVIPATLG